MENSWIEDNNLSIEDALAMGLNEWVK